MQRGRYFDRYSCEFDFIPNVLSSLYMNGDIDDYVMTHPMEWKKILSKKGFRYDFGIKNISVEKIEDPSKKAKFIITFPAPKVVPECFYAILYIGKSGYKYFTLELDFGSSIVFKDGGGIICGQSGSMHLNYGKRCKPDLDEFQKFVQDIIDGKSLDRDEDYKNIDYKEAAKLVGMNEEDLKEKCFIY